jgi:hypothetical protein
MVWFLLTLIRKTMKNNYIRIFILTLLLCGVNVLSAQQSVSKNTANAAICGCPGAVWDLSTPYMPTVTFSVAGDSKRVMFSDYKFNIPANSVVDGIKVNFVYTMNNTAPNTLKETVVTLMTPSLMPVQDKSPAAGAFINSSSGLITYGGPTDTWGAYWTSNEINSPAFGFNFKLNTTAAPADFTFQNGATITVYYTLANGIKDSQTSSSGIHAYVNNRKLVIETLSRENTMVEIFALTGRKVLSANLENNSEKSVNLSELPKGVYLYNIKTENGTKTSKFLLD